MKVELAKMAGFCFGVNRAVDTVYEEAKQFSPVYTYGPIIHNETVIDDLEKKVCRSFIPWRKPKNLPRVRS